jgi:hypothetical protein
MNERIIELRKKAWVLVQTDLQTNERDECVDNREHLKMVFEKFAELIVRECTQVSLKVSHRDDDMGAIIARMIKEHFGVE